VCGVGLRVWQMVWLTVVATSDPSRAGEPPSVP
jgi:hypothetical protein